MKLSITQKRALSKFSKHPSKWQSSFEVGEKISTLNSLVEKNLLSKTGQGSPGAIFSPATTIKYKLK